ncbi:MAG: sigma-70 family RNA polymerase sigma factor [Bacteroidaceae bacterium]|nr:sigma-70 family RNA polymerase sigma factor [Bacteroidaceae bacterium]
MIDQTIVHELFCQYYSEMICLARTLIYAEEEAEDTVQDVFVRLLEADILPAEDKARAYLMKAVRNGCINRIRKKSLTEQIQSLYSIEAETDLLFIEERLETLDAVCDFADTHLSEPHRTIFRLRFQEDLTLKDIAKRLDMNLKTVFKYLGQSIEEMQKHYRH